MPMCVLCGLTFSNRALLELHIRDDHPKRSGPGEAGHHGTPERKPPQLRTGAVAEG
jgi:hypothetical protein